MIPALRHISSAADHYTPDTISVQRYLYCAANPVMFTDPTGEDIYRFDENTGDIVLMQKTDDKFDQIGDYKYDKKTKEYTLKTDRKGNAKTKIDKIKKGILRNGINFKENDNIISIQNTNITIEDIRDFITQLSDIVNKEISGITIEERDKSLSYVVVGKYKNNTLVSAVPPSLRTVLDKTGHKVKELNTLTLTHWHVHSTKVNNGISPEIASEEDYRNKKHNKDAIKVYEIWILDFERPIIY